MKQGFLEAQCHVLSGVVQECGLSWVEDVQWALRWHGHVGVEELVACRVRVTCSVRVALWLFSDTF